MALRGAQQDRPPTRNNRKWQEAFDMVRSGADIPALVAADPTSETAHLWGLGFEMDAGAMFSLARQIVASVRAEDAAAHGSETASRSSKVIQSKEGHNAKSEIADLSLDGRPTANRELVTAAKASTASVGPVEHIAQGHGIATKEPKLVPPKAPRVRTPAGKLDEAMRFLRDGLHGEVAATVVEARARKVGIATKTLKRARAKLGVVSRRDGFGPHGKFYLSLPWDHSGPTGA